MGDTRRRSVVSVVAAVVVGALLVTPAARALGEDGTPADPAQDVAARLSAKPHDHPAGTFQSSIAERTHVATEASGPVGAAASLPPGFSDVEVISGVSEAVSVAFAPAGTAFVALKTGLIKSFDHTGTSFESSATATDFADLRTPVNNYWDRGLTGITLDPQFGTPGRNFVYVSYTFNRDPRDNPPVVPKWGDPAEAYDQCAAPATTSPARPGCPVMMRVSRLTAQQGANGWVMVPGSELPLLTSGCFQFGSHASGDVVVGPDGKLYASAGEGASFDTLDYGQYANPCPGDPANEGGSLRSQDYRTASDDLGVDGSIVRIDPVAGVTPTQANASQWLVAYGQRNPWRLAFRPGTNQLWSGDVGGSSWEEINRLDGATSSTTPVNRGWPCYEGAYTGIEKHQGWDALDRPICETLYADVAAGRTTVAAPYFSYQTRGPKLTPNEDCQNSTSSVSGVAFTTTGGNYPAAYKDALFFSDFARSCVWRLAKLPNGDPDPTTIVPFVEDAQTPVNLKVGPGGDLYYVDYGLRPDGSVDPGQAGVHRIVYSGTTNSAPTARITADNLSGPAPLTVTFDGRTSTDPENDTLTYAWDLDGDTQYDDSTSATPQRTFAAGTHTVGLQVRDPAGLTSTTSVEVQAGNTPPVLGTITPTSAATWKVGQEIAFSGSATDAQDGALPASALRWEVLIRHCPGGSCHTHPLTAFEGQASGSFEAPDHEYPSHLLLTVTAADSGGLTATRTIQLDPRTVDLTWASSPSGATVTINGTDHTTPYTETFIRGSQLTMIAAPTFGSAPFRAWSDRGARVHEVSAPSQPRTYTATYAVPNTAPTVQRLTAYPSNTYHVGQTLGFDAFATDPEQALPDTAYSFEMLRQDCATGCPQVSVQRWQGVQNGQFVVPAMSYPSRLRLVVRVTDAQGAVGVRRMWLNPQVAKLRVTATSGLPISVDGTATTDFNGYLVRAATVTVSAPLTQVRNGVTWTFVSWSDGGAREHSLRLWDARRLKAVYERTP